MKKDIAARNARILALRGKKSFGLIAKEFGMSRGAVAGVMWRDTWPAEKRINSSPHSRGNCCGRGHRGGAHLSARKTLLSEAAE